MVLTNPDGTMARIPEILEFSGKHDIPVVSVEDIKICPGGSVSCSPCTSSATATTGRTRSPLDRVAKYNQLLRIEEELGENARYAGLSHFSRK